MAERVAVVGGLPPAARRLTRRDAPARRGAHGRPHAAHGLTNDAIAAQLIISPLTAKTHLNRAMTKLGVNDRAQLVIVAYETGVARVGGRLG
ncbi:MAG: response regulator transcription factor [Acidimicrobiales bacterium]